jgi:parallel beta-helix repeat protein
MSNARNLGNRATEIVSVRDYGARGDGVTDDTAAIQAAIDAANGVFFPSGTYLVSAQINVKANLFLRGEGGSKISLKVGVTPYVLRGNAVNNFTMRDLEIEGNGAVGLSTVYITNSTNVTVDNCKITKSGSIAIQIVNCTFAKVENCTLSSNYFYGLEFRDCDGCKAIANQCVDNGNTGVATSTGGRGINLWRSRGCYVAGNRFVTNTEYGFRIYSEAADGTTSYNNVVTGNVFLDNTRADLVLYDEGAAFSFVAYNAISDNLALRTTNATLGASFILQGDYNTFVNNQIKKAGTFGTDCAFNFFNANYCTISSCYVENMAQAFSTSSSANITIENCFGNGVANGLTVPTTGIIVKNCRFIKGGAGASDTCINNTVATGKNYYEGNIISGFYRGIWIGDENVALYRNTTTGSTLDGIAKTGNSLAGLECSDNQFDTCSNYLLSSLRKGTAFHYRAELTYPAAPTTLTWQQGDRCWSQNQTVGQPIGWICTVAGTPGTWVAMVNL